jgi:hypothetical protein
LAQVDAISELGHHMAGRDIERALRLLNEAHALIAASPLDDLGVRVRSGRICGLWGANTRPRSATWALSETCATASFRR